MRKLIGIISAIALVLSFSACDSEKTDITTTSDVTTEITETSDVSTTEILETKESVTVTHVEDTTDNTSDNTTEESETESIAETDADKESIPTTKEEIVSLYNNATVKASQDKPGYNKTTNTAVNNLQMGALAKFKIVRDTISDFLGEGVVKSTVTKGKFDGDSLVISKLTASDVSSATCKVSDDGKYYDVKITVKNETNPLKGKSSLGKFTNDYKDANEIRQGLIDADATVNGITINTTSVIITAKISVDGNEFYSLNHLIKMSGVLTDVKYTVAKVSQATVDLVVDTNYSSFVY